MDVVLLNTNWLNTFVTLIDTKHFTKTAHKLFMTQPGVSQHIRKLEQACGHSLILREKKSFEITEQGRLMYEYAKQLKNNEKRLLAQLTFDEPYIGQCNLACSGALALLLYPKLLTIQARHSALIMQLKAAPNHQILTEVEHGDIDLGLVTHTVKNNLFDIQEVGNEHLCLVLPARADIDPINRDSLSKVGLIDHPDAGHYLTRYFTQNAQLGMADFRIEQIPVTGYINQINQILEPVAKGLGFTVLPKSVIDNFHTPELLSIYQSDNAVIETIYLVKKRSRELPARFKTVLQMLAEHFDCEIS